jgi:hypothetical protein
LEKRAGVKINLDVDPEQAGKEFGRKLSDAKREATVKVGQATVKVKVAAKKVTSKKAPAKKPVAKKPAARKPKA